MARNEYVRLRASAVATQNVRLHRPAAQSRPQKNRSRFVPVQSIPSAKSCSRRLAERTSGRSVVAATPLLASRTE